MTAVVPSFLVKLNRAEKHLVDLEEAIRRYAGTGPGTRPYEVRRRVEGKREVHRLVFTRHPANTEIPSILADGLYNLRGSLDHLMAALVPAKNRTSVMFPILWRGVWEPPIEGEDEERSKARQRWITYTRDLPKEAVTFLRRLQPPDDAGQGKETHFLRDLNGLVNRDRHEKLPVTIAGIPELVIRWKTQNGDWQMAIGQIDEGAMAKDQAQLRGIPDDAVNVEADGPPDVVIDVGKESAYIGLPDFLADGIKFVRDPIAATLTPHIRPTDKATGRRKR